MCFEGCDYKVLSSKAKASSRNFQLQNSQDTKLKFMFLFLIMNPFTKHKYFNIY